MGLKVIGTGFGRTGTDSMREALNILGFGPCHHMVEVNNDPEQKRLWRALAAGAAPDWEQLFAGYASCVDFPSACFWRELLAFYPDAKALLTWRPTESWWDSYAQSAGPVIANSDEPESLGVALVANKLFGGRPMDRDHVIEVYEAHVTEVRATGAAGSAARTRPRRRMGAAVRPPWGDGSRSAISATQFRRRVPGGDPAAARRPAVGEQDLLTPPGSAPGVVQPDRSRPVSVLR